MGNSPLIDSKGPSIRVSQWQCAGLSREKREQMETRWIR